MIGNNLWGISVLDKALINLVNRGSWLYSTPIDSQKLRDSLEKTLEYYPVFKGRMAADNGSIALCNAEIAYEESAQAQFNCDEIAEEMYLPSLLKAKYDVKGFKKGAFPVLSVKVVKITGGTLVSVAINHVCADGATLYRFMKDWADIFSGRAVTPPVCAQDLFPKPHHTKEELAAILAEKKWYKVGMSDLFSMITDRISNTSIVAKPIFISNAFLEELRTTYSIGKEVGNNALLCALTCNRIAGRREMCSVASVVNLRGRAIYPEGFVGNAVANITSPEFDIDEGIGAAASIIDADLRSKISERESLEDFFRLYTEAMTLKLPFIPFNLGGTCGKHPSCLIVNNFCGFDIYGVDFGGSAPLKAYPNDLPDNIKIWPGRKDEDGVYLLLRGKITKSFTAEEVRGRCQSGRFAAHGADDEAS